MRRRAVVWFVLVCPVVGWGLVGRVAGAKLKAVHSQTDCEDSDARDWLTFLLLLHCLHAQAGPMMMQHEVDKALAQGPSGAGETTSRLDWREFLEWGSGQPPVAPPIPSLPPQPPVAPLETCSCACSSEDTYEVRVPFCFPLPGCYQRRSIDGLPEFVDFSFSASTCPAPTFYHPEFCYGERGCWRRPRTPRASAYVRAHACCGVELDSERQQSALQLAARILTVLVIVALLLSFGVAWWRSPRLRRRVRTLILAARDALQRTEPDPLALQREREARSKLKALPTRRWAPRGQRGAAAAASAARHPARLVALGTPTSSVAPGPGPDGAADDRDTFRADQGGSTNDTCALCLDDYERGDIVRVLPCRHIFHRECVDQMFLAPRQRGRARACPICRQNPLVPQSI